MQNKALLLKLYHKVFQILLCVFNNINFIIKA